MNKRYCPTDCELAAAPCDGAERCDAHDEAQVERAAALMGHDALIAQAEGELAAVLRRKVARRR